MPSPADILGGLSEIANQARGLAVAWHVAFALALAAIAVGLRPSRRVVASVSVLPLLSVAALAWTFGNPFNGSAFVLLAAALLAIGTRLPREAASPGPAWARVLGLGLLAFGWTYPHFLRDASGWAYLYAAPLGLIPCPTLSAVIGVSLVAGGHGSRPFSLALGGAGAFYALFGALRLGVLIDLALLAGAVGMLWLGVRPHQPDPGRAGGGDTPHDPARFPFRRPLFCYRAGHAR